MELSEKDKLKTEVDRQINHFNEDPDNYVSGKEFILELQKLKKKL